MKTPVIFCELAICDSTEKGRLAHLGIETGSNLDGGESERTQVVDLLVRPTGIEPVTS